MTSLEEGNPNTTIGIISCDALPPVIKLSTLATITARQLLWLVVGSTYYCAISIQVDFYVTRYMAKTISPISRSTAT